MGQPTGQPQKWDNLKEFKRDNKKAVPEVVPEVVPLKSLMNKGKNAVRGTTGQPFSIELLN